MNISSATASPSTISYRPPQEDSSVKAKNITEIPEEDKKEIQDLKSRDQVVRAHEAAHIAAGGGLVRGAAHYSFQKGPDGVQYAIGGDVSIDISKVSGDPQASLQKAQQIQAAALAPAQPSSQDRAVAAQAAQMAIEARAEISQQKSESSNNVSALPDISTSSAESLGNVIDFTA